MHVRPLNQGESGRMIVHKNIYIYRGFSNDIGKKREKERHKEREGKGEDPM